MTNPYALQEALFLKTKQGQDQRAQMAAETLALIDEVNQRKRGQAIQDEGRAWNREQQGRTRQEWGREDEEWDRQKKTRPISDAVMVANAVKTLAPGMGPKQYVDLVSTIEKMGYDTTALPRDVKNTRGLMEKLYPEETWRHQLAAEEMSRRESGGSSRSVIAGYDNSGNPAYFSIDPRTGSVVKMEGIVPAMKTGGRDDALTPAERARLYSDFGGQYDKNYSDVGGGYRTGAPERTRWIQTQIDTALADGRDVSGGDGGNVQVSDETIALQLRGDRFRTKFVPEWNRMSEDEKDALYVEIAGVGTENSQKLLDMIDQHELSVKTGRKKLERSGKNRRETRENDNRQKTILDVETIR